MTFIDAIHLRVRESQVGQLPVLRGHRFTVEGRRDILGTSAGDGGEGATYWLQSRPLRRGSRSSRGREIPDARYVVAHELVGGIECASSGSPSEPGPCQTETHRALATDGWRTVRRPERLRP